MAVQTHKFVSAIADGGDATLVRPSNWNDQHALTPVAGTVTVTDSEWINLVRLTLDGTDRATLAGTARCYIFGWGDNRVYNIVGFPKQVPMAPFRVPDGFEVYIVNRTILQSNVRGILEGNADVILADDFGTRSRIVLQGVG